MNLLSDLSSELAVAILIEKKHSEKVDSNEALNLIDKVCDILQPISTEKNTKNGLTVKTDVKAANH